MLIGEYAYGHCINMKVEADAERIENGDGWAWRAYGITDNAGRVELFSHEGSEHYGPQLVLINAPHKE